MSKLEPSVIIAEMPNPSPAEQLLPQFEALWSVIKDWDINVPTHYRGYCGGNGSHVKMLLDALAIYRGEFRARENLLIKVMHTTGDDPFIIGVNGECTTEGLHAIEEQISGEEHEFEHGPGLYTYEAYFMQGEQDEFGRSMFLSCWELTKVAFEQPEWAKPVDPNAPKKPCPTCGLVDCGGKDVFDACIPF